MGRNKRKGNRWKAKNADKSRLGSGSGSGTTADSEDDPESYTNPGNTNRRKRGSGKLRGGTRDDDASRNGAEASPAPNNINGDNEPSGAGLRAEGGLSGGPQEEGVESTARTPAAVDLPEQQQQQQEEEQVQHIREIDETGGVDDEKKEDLSEVDAKAIDGASGGGNDDDANSGLAASPCDSPSQPAARSTCRGVIVPALPFGSSLEPADGGRGGKTGRVRSSSGRRQNKQYSLAWAGGKKGRPLMKNVEGVLLEWLCAQEAKGVCVGEAVAAVGTLARSKFVPLGQLAERLAMPEGVACALGLRLRGREWEELLGKIAAARDFLDLRAESACSSALAAFGGQASAPWPTDQIPIDAFAALAREEAAGLDLAELELRQELRTHASRVAPRCCPSAASSLFLQGLDPDAMGAVSTSDLARFASHLVGLPPDHGIGPSSRLTPRGTTTTGTPRGTAAVGWNGGRRSSRTGSFSFVEVPVPRSTVSEGKPTRPSSFPFCGSSCASDRDRARRFHGVIERLASAARMQEARRDDGVSGEIGITRSTFCRFVEGKRFDERSLEGFLRALSRAGRLSAPISAIGAANEAASAPHGQAMYSAATGRKENSPVDSGAPRATVGTARWGARGLRRASSQFAHQIHSATAIAPSGGKRATTMAQTRSEVFQGPLSATAPARGADGGGIGTSRSSRGGGYASSRSWASAASGGVAGRGGVVLATPRERLSGRRGSGFVEETLSSFDSNGSGTLSSAQFISASNQATGLPIRREWGKVLATRFAAGRDNKIRELGASRGGGEGGGGGRRGGGAGEGGVRWLGESRDGNNGNRRLDIATLVDFLRPKHFSLSVMTPFGLVELLLEDPCLTLGGLREIVVNKMFWRQHNCQVRRSDRDNFTLSRYLGTLPLDTESPGQRRRLVLDVLRPGELIFVTDRAARRDRHEEPRDIPRFQYMMGARRKHAGGDTPGSCWGPDNTAKVSPKRRQFSPAAAAAAAATGPAKACAPPRRSSAPSPSSSPPRRQLIRGAATASANAAQNSARSDTGDGSSSFPGERLFSATTATSKVSSPASRRQPVDGTRSSFKPGVLDVAPGEEGPLLPGWEGAGKHVDLSSSGLGSGRDSPSTKERRAFPDAPTLVFDWSEDQVVRWIGEAMELERYREAFQVNKIDGFRLGGLTQDDLTKDLGIKNVFHARKIVLHLDRLMDEALGQHPRNQIPRAIESWRNREFLMWCWQRVGVRHRPTLAVLRQASIDGLVLLAMESDNWTRLAAASPRHCHAPLENLRRASLSRPGAGTGIQVVPRPPGSNAAPSTGDDTVGPVENTFRSNSAHDSSIERITTAETSSAPDFSGGGQAPPRESDEKGPKTGGASGGDRRAAGLVGEGRGKNDQEGMSTSPSRTVGGLFDGQRPPSRDDSGVESSAVVAG